MWFTCYFRIKCSSIFEGCEGFPFPKIALVETLPPKHGPKALVFGMIAPPENERISPENQWLVGRCIPYLNIRFFLGDIRSFSGV